MAQNICESIETVRRALQLEKLSLQSYNTTWLRLYLLKKIKTSCKRVIFLIKQRNVFFFLEMQDSGSIPDAIKFVLLYYNVLVN